MGGRNVTLLWALVLVAGIAVKLSQSQSTDLMICSFDDGDLCGFQQSNQDDFDWTLQQGRTPSTHTGPSRDHTQNSNKSGRYIYIESSSPRRHGDVASMISPSFNAPILCRITLSFYYNMYGSDMGNLTIKIHDSDLPPLWSKTGQQPPDGNIWSKATVEFPQNLTTSPFQFEIVGTTGATYLGDIAVDDVGVRKLCHQTTTTTTTTTPTTTTPTTTTTTPTTTTTTTPTTTTTTPTTTTTTPTTTTTTSTTTTTAPSTHTKTSSAQSAPSLASTQWNHPTIQVVVNTTQMQHCTQDTQFYRGNAFDVTNFNVHTELRSPNEMKIVDKQFVYICDSSFYRDSMLITRQVV